MLELKDPDEFWRQYDAQLAALDPVRVVEDLTGSILLCWEPVRFDVRTKTVLCHRYRVAMWIAAAGIHVDEWTESDRLQLNLQPL